MNLYDKSPQVRKAYNALRAAMLSALKPDTGYSVRLDTGTAHYWDVGERESIIDAILADIITHKVEEV